MVEWKTLGDICEIKGRIGFRGYTRENQVDKGNGAISLSPGNIFDSVLNYDSCTYITWEKYEESPEIMVNEGDIILCKTASVGKVARVRQLPEKATINPQLVLIKNIKTNPQYLFYILDDTPFQVKIKGLAGVGSVPNVSQAKLSSIQIPIPSLEEQNRIVGILDTFTASIDNLKEQIAQRRKQYEYYRCCLFSAGKWLEHRIGELTKVFSCPRVFKYQWQKSGVPFWRSSDIMSYHNGVINPRGEVYISQSLYEELSSKTDKIKDGDILVTGGGSIGIPYLKKDNSPLFVKDADLICIQKCSSIIPKYLYHYFLSTDFKLYLKKITHDATIAHYTINQIKDTPIPLPPLSDQQRIVSILDTFEASIQNLEAQLSQREKQYEYYRNKLLTFE